MKKFLKIILAFAFGFALVACSREEDKVAYNNTSPSTLKASTDKVVLTKADAAKPAITFSWTRPSYQPSLAPSNKLQIDLKGNNFAKPYEIDLDPSVNEVTLSQLELNQIMLKLGAPFSATNIEARIKSYFTSTASIEPIYSDVLNLNVTPYALISYMYMPGDYQGWNPTTANVLTSATSNGVYVGYITFTQDHSLEFKVTQNNDWNIAYGSDDAATLSATGGNIKAPGYGSYQITVDMNKMTISFKPYSWGVIGSATPNGWNGPDVVLAWNEATKKWEGTASLVAGEAKIRLNNSWDSNYGGSGLSGTAVSGGDNVKITDPGNYKIVFDEANLTYSFTKQ